MGVLRRAQSVVIDEAADLLFKQRNPKGWAVEKRTELLESLKTKSKRYEWEADDDERNENFVSLEEIEVDEDGDDVSGDIVAECDLDEYNNCCAIQLLMEPSAISQKYMNLLFKLCEYQAIINGYNFIMHTNVPKPDGITVNPQKAAKVNKWKSMAPIFKNYRTKHNIYIVGKVLT